MATKKTAKRKKARVHKSMSNISREGLVYEFELMAHALEADPEVVASLVAGTVSALTDAKNLSKLAKKHPKIFKRIEKQIVEMAVYVMATFPSARTVADKKFKASGGKIWDRPKKKRAAKQKRRKPGS